MEDTLGVSQSRLKLATLTSLNPYCNGRYSWCISNFFRYAANLASVLILIVMEDTHGDFLEFCTLCGWRVLILIVMEDTHGVDYGLRKEIQRGSVLILIVMEDTLGGTKFTWKDSKGNES